MAVASFAGFADGALQAIASPPPIVRAGLSGAAIVLGGRLLLGALGRIDRSIRGEEKKKKKKKKRRTWARSSVAFASSFSAAAAFTAAGGWSAP